MFRKVLLYAAVIALFAPTLLAQGVTVCVFQGKEPHNLATQYASDIQNVVTELTGKTLPNGASIQAIAVPDVSPKDQDAAAQSHQCGYVVSVWREEILRRSSRRRHGRQWGRQRTRQPVRHEPAE